MPIQQRQVDSSVHLCSRIIWSLYLVTAHPSTSLMSNLFMFSSSYWHPNRRYVITQTKKSFIVSMPVSRQLELVQRYWRASLYSGNSLDSLPSEGSRYLFHLRSLTGICKPASHCCKITTESLLMSTSNMSFWLITLQFLHCKWADDGNRSNETWALAAFLNTLQIEIGFNLIVVFQETKECYFIYFFYFCVVTNTSAVVSGRDGLDLVPKPD